eukprot:gnl/Dysnectes_brevis/3467_a4395_610.p1 GENE.gnl/Dysnectes_brevis/3467_a4395_610~~gnl/Dysnectes_brevis/3467_a4395_610.p1  ORF type:complete len:385 (-),score=139.19 gnl/Dysnectes_brevis/3467_a4395_610:57-1211(-)
MSDWRKLVGEATQARKRSIGKRVQIPNVDPSKRETVVRVIKSGTPGTTSSTEESPAVVAHSPELTEAVKAATKDLGGFVALSTTMLEGVRRNVSEDHSRVDLLTRKAVYPTCRMRVALQLRNSLGEVPPHIDPKSALGEVRLEHDYAGAGLSAPRLADFTDWELQEDGETIIAATAPIPAVLVSEEAPHPLRVRLRWRGHLVGRQYDATIPSFFHPDRRSRLDGVVKLSANSTVATKEKQPGVRAVAFIHFVPGMHDMVTLRALSTRRGQLEVGWCTLEHGKGSHSVNLTTGEYQPPSLDFSLDAPNFPALSSGEEFRVLREARKDKRDQVTGYDLIVFRRKGSNWDRAYCVSLPGEVGDPRFFCVWLEDPTDSLAVVDSSISK